MLKKRFIIELILIILNLDKKMRIEMNASDYIISYPDLAIFVPTYR